MNKIKQIIIKLLIIPLGIGFTSFALPGITKVGKGRELSFYLLELPASDTCYKIKELLDKEFYEQAYQLSQLLKNVSPNLPVKDQAKLLNNYAICAYLHNQFEEAKIYIKQASFKDQSFVLTDEGREISNNIIRMLS